MKTKFHYLFIILALGSAITLQPATSHAQGTAFTYQGRLSNSGGAANGSYDLQFAVFDAAAAGNLVGSALTTNAVAISNGLFTVGLDFGGGVFNTGADRWLFLSVKTNGAVAFTPLAPPQHITATPYAMTAGNLSGSLPGTSLGGTYGNPVTLNNAANSFTGNGANLTALNASQLASGTVPAAALGNAWRIGGNAGTSPGTHFLGTTDGQALQLKVNNTVALQIMPGVTLPNIVGGLAAFRPSVIASGVSGAVIAGGNAPSGGVNGFGGGDFQAVYDDDGTVGGGFGNKVGTDNGDVTDAAFATVAGGVFNGAAGYAATIGGGDGNQSGGSRSVVGGGFGNVGVGDFSSIGGGLQNAIQIGATNSSIGGGLANTANAVNSVIAGGADNQVVGLLNLFGGLQPADGSFIGGGEYNSISPREEPPVFLFPIYFNALNSMVGGGLSNTISGGSYASIPGGLNNSVKGDFGLAAGRRAKANHTGAFVWGDSTDADFASTAANQFAIRASGGILLSDSTPNISFGSTTRQMLNLYSTSFGIGVQSSTLYFRCQNTAPTDGFIWYRGGVHNDNYVSAGGAGGGTEMMHLVTSGLYVNGAIVLTSDRNAKENFAPVSPRAVLDKVAALPISRWNYKADKASDHLGPMAQDFYAAFGVGPDDKHITTVDADGVALAAIQGLNQKLEQQAREKDTEIDALKARLEKLEALIKSPTDSQK